MASDATRDSELFEAIASTFALVAASDGDLADVEVERLRAWGTEQGFDEASVEILAEQCRSFGRVLADQGAEDLRRTLLDRLESLRDGGRRASLVLGAARVAVVADEKIEEAEEQVIREVGAALGLDPDLV